MKGLNMILFLQDWLKYPGAIIHTTTKNKSFYRMALLLKSMGVKNHAFCLALHNVALIDVDPHDPNLSEETIYNIVEESKVNPWYFFREVVKIPAMSSIENVSLQANRGNISLFWLFFNHITTMLIQPRQTGKSVSVDALMELLLLVLTVNTQFNLLTKDDNLRSRNVIRIKDMMECLPYYFKLRTRADVNNTEKITIGRLGNVYNTNVAQASPKAALNLGRGMSLAVNHIDEISFIKNIRYTLPAMLAASGAARDAARAVNAPYGNIFTTTPGYLSSDSGEFAYKLYLEAFPWTELLFDVDSEEALYKFIRTNNRKSKTLMVLLEYNHRQLGKTDEWLAGKIEDAMSDGEDAEADFLNKWAKGNEISPIPKDILEMIIKSEVPEPYIQPSEYGYIIRWFIPAAEVMAKASSRKLILCLDTSDAIGSDDIALMVRDAMSGETVATGVYNETNVIVFSDWVASLLIEYENLTLIIERRSTGTAIIDNLLKILPAKGIDPFKRIFNWAVDDAIDKEDIRKEIIDTPFNRRDPYVYIKYRKDFGYATSGAGRNSRDNIYGTAFNASTKYTGQHARDKTLIKQLSRLISKNGRIDHRPNEHDDMVFSWLLGYWFLTMAKNKSFYGLSNHLVLAGVSFAMVQEQGGYEVVANRNRQIRIKTEINDLLEYLKIERNPIKSELITNRIKHLYRDVEIESREAFNIETLLEAIMLEKKKNRIIQR